MLHYQSFFSEALESLQAVNAYLSLLEFAAMIDIQMSESTEYM
jgi:hypothetical protein